MTTATTPTATTSTTDRDEIVEIRHVVGGGDGEVELLAVGTADERGVDPGVVSGAHVGLVVADEQRRLRVQLREHAIDVVGVGFLPAETLRGGVAADRGVEHLPDAVVVEHVVDGLLLVRGDDPQRRVDVPQHRHVRVEILPTGLDLAALLAVGVEVACGPQVLRGDVVAVGDRPEFVRRDTDHHRLHVVRLRVVDGQRVEGVPRRLPEHVVPRPPHQHPVVVEHYGVVHSVTTGSRGVKSLTLAVGQSHCPPARRRCRNRQGNAAPSESVSDDPTPAADTIRVTTGGRLHFGFGNLSLAHERLYGACGVALAEPRLRLTVEPAGDDTETPPATDATDNTPASEYATAVCELLSVPAVRVTVQESLPRHAGLGSGTQTALAVLAGVARLYGREPRVRERAPALGRGGRSGVGVATFERGGFVLDAGHPTERFTADPPADGDWTVPPVAAHHRVPADWRFLVVLPDAEPGRSGDGEDASMRSVVESAEPVVADRIAGVLARRLLPAVAGGAVDRSGAVDRFGAAVRELGRLNGSWFADEQGGVYRPPVGDVVSKLTDAAAVSGVGQSSWGPAVYAVTDADRAGDARAAGERALAAADVDGEVILTAARDQGATVERV